MTFGAPLWLYALGLLPVLLALFFWNERRRAVLLRRLVAARLQPELAGSLSTRKRRLRFLLLLAGLACVIVALAQPRLGYTFEQSRRKGRDVLIAVDVSKSMMATDVAPSRLERAKLAAQDLIHALPGDRVGLVAFAGTAFLQAPLTIDYSAVLASVTELNTDVIPRGGTDIAGAIRVAAEAFGKGESTNRALVLFTDGEELEENAVAAARANAESFRIFTVGVGSKEGSLIPAPGERGGGTAFVKDENGEYVKSRLDEGRLAEIAQASGGFYLPLGSGSAAVKSILENGLGKMQEHDIDARQARRPIERYQWPLAAGLALLAGSMMIGERRRAVQRGKAARDLQRAGAAAALAVFLLAPASAWSRNRGVELYEQKDYKGALDTFQKQLGRNPKSDALHFDAGTAAYQSGDYDHALEAFSRAATAGDPALRAKAEYNLANTLVQRGARQKEPAPKLREWRNALEHYDEALRADAKNESAKYNRELVRKSIEELEKQHQQQQPKPDQQKNDDSKQNPKQDQKSDSQKNQQSKQDKTGQSKPDDASKNGEQEKPQDQQQKPDDSKDQQSGGEKQQPETDAQQNGGGQPDEKKPGDQNEAGQNKEGEKLGDEKQRDEQPKNANGQSSKEHPPQEGNGSQNAEAKASPQPSPGDGKLSGEIQAQNQAGAERDPAAQTHAARAAAAAAEEKPGEMSEAQARALIESLKGEDGHVSLQERKRSAPVSKDW